MGTNEVEQLILTLGKEMGKDEEEMKKFVEIIVNKNWYDRVELLKSITNEQWKTMNIPLRLVDMIKKRVSSEVKEFEVEEDSNEAAKQVLKESTWEFEYLTPENLEMSPSLYNSIESLVNIPRDKLKGVTDLLFKIIDSIIKEPRKGKIRRIKMKNPKFASTVGSFVEALNVLKSVGFVQVSLKTSEIFGNSEDCSNEEQEEYIELPVAYISRLTDCHHLLAIFCERNKIDYPKLVPCDLNSIDNSNENSVKISHFNPYVSNISSTSASSNNEFSRNLMKSAIEERRQIESEIKKRERDMENGIINEFNPQDDGNIISSKPFVIHSSNIQKFDNLVKEINDIDSQEDLDNDVTSHFEQSEIQRIKDSILGKAPAFKSRTNEYLKSLLKRKVHSHSSIRVVFPDKYILQLQFRPNNTTYDLIQSVKDCINPNISSMNWYVYQSPPILKVNPDKNLTLLKAGFVPNAQLYFKLELPPNHTLKGNYIKAQLLNEDT
ncbi:uncharacterized protein cubi_02500 [Cryptosporidium ubiquitum]|uniref:PUB domain-containing protein n=1 Tax=Cryptosporidium ubiquitum TaxID=857276 RepID=A0A1J4MJS8_9CRYT|nr:uncharacterized protein cubi_02500 [Cryptosporidium ubiquitum]OII73268.1 hypothetical protein cubi_02500 [Cryptosporidium ubiquitum]